MVASSQNHISGNFFSKKITQFQFYNDSEWTVISEKVFALSEFTTETWSTISTDLNRVDLIIDFAQLKIDVDLNFKMSPAQLQIKNFFTAKIQSMSADFELVLQKFLLSMVRFDSTSGSVQAQMRSYFEQFSDTGFKISGLGLFEAYPRNVKIKRLLMDHTSHDFQDFSTLGAD